MSNVTAETRNIKKVFYTLLMSFALISFIAFTFQFLILPAFAQDSSTSSGNISKTQKRLNRIEAYYKKSAMFRNFKDEAHRTAALKYYELTQSSLEEGKKCRAEEGEDIQKKKACDRLITQDYDAIRRFYRLLKYYQIEEGAPFICVRAELGVGKTLKARGISKPDIFARYLETGQPDPENPKETGRTGNNQVYLCTGENGQRKLRVPTENGRYVKLTPEELDRPDLALPNLPPANSIETLESEFGLN